MRGTAALFVEAGRPFELREYEVPEPEPGALIVEILQTNVCGSDLHIWRGDVDLRRLGRPLPAVLGHEAVGAVVAIGPGLAVDGYGHEIQVGDRVVWRYFFPCRRCRACLTGRSRACQANHGYASRGQSSDEAPHFVGPFATHFHVPPGAEVFRVPDGLPDTVAAAANCAVAQVIQAFASASLEIGETVVVQGAGGLGLYACAVAKARGAGRVVVLDAQRDRLDLAAGFGADVTLDLTDLPDARSRVRAVRQATDGGGDLVCELVGHASAVAEGLGMVAPGGRYLELGCVRTGTSFELDPARLTLFSRSILGMMCYEPWALAEALAFLDRTRADHPWEQLTPAPYPLHDIDRAFADAAERRVPRAAVIPI